MFLKEKNLSFLLEVFESVKHQLKPGGFLTSLIIKTEHSKTSKEICNLHI